MNGQISIVRPGACDDSEIHMIIRLARGKTITVLTTPENLALALTGKSDLRCTGNSGHYHLFFF
ncbi:hypothetical protein OF865_19620 [Escherichia coli]|nr:hypothetical protein OF865_19620 [Escherichia coli]